MYKVELHQGINKMMEAFRLVGFWQKGDESTASETIKKLFFSTYYSLFFLSILVGAFTCDTIEESIFALANAVIVLVMLVKLLHMIWKKQTILDLLNRICVHSIEDQKQFATVAEKLETFMKFMAILGYTTLFGATSCVLGIPFLGSERKQFLNIWFPFDWKTSEIVFWVEFAFISIGVMHSWFSFLFSTFLWYLLFNCALKYEVLGNRLRSMGKLINECGTFDERIIPEKEKEIFFVGDLIDSIKLHKGILETTDDLGSFLSNMLSFQLATSALSICCSTYSLAFNNDADTIEFVVYLNYLIYSFHDIFMVMYYGNKIKLSSERLLYSLFESNWPDRSQSCKKFIIIFSERLKQTQQLTILKLHPLTLDTFTRILNTTYSMFNILKSSK